MSTHDPMPLPSHTATGKPSKCFWFSTVLVINSWALGVFLSVFVAPVFAEMFADFGAKLPKPTQIVINTSDFMKSYFLFIQFPIAGLLALTIWGLNQLDKRNKKAPMLFIGIVPVALIGIYLIALFLPIVYLSSVTAA